MGIDLFMYEFHMQRLPVDVAICFVKIMKSTAIKHVPIISTIKVVCKQGLGSSASEYMVQCFGTPCRRIL